MVGLAVEVLHVKLVRLLNLNEVVDALQRISFITIAQEHGQVSYPEHLEVLPDGLELEQRCA